MKPNIMFVNDSSIMLDSLQWIFKDEPYYLFAFNNPSEALSVIKTLDWAVVVAEQSAPKMDGLDFLKKVKEKSPQTMGIIITNDNDINGAFDNLYPGCVSQIVKKPLDNIEIKQAVKMGVDRYYLNIENIKNNVNGVSSVKA